MGSDARPQGDWDLDGFERHLSARSAATRRAYRADLSSGIEWLLRLGVASPTDVTRLQLRRYLASLQTRGRSRATIARHAASLRAYFSWLQASRGAPGEPNGAPRPPAARP